jgi:hypothetical protein
MASGCLNFINNKLSKKRKRRKRDFLNKILKTLRNDIEESKYKNLKRQLSNRGIPIKVKLTRIWIKSEQGTPQLFAIISLQ